MQRQKFTQSRVHLFAEPRLLITIYAHLVSLGFPPGTSYTATLNVCIVPLCPLLDCDFYSLAMILNATKAERGVYAQESLARGRKKASARAAGKCVWQ